MLVRNKSQFSNEFVQKIINWLLTPKLASKLSFIYIKTENDVVLDGTFFPQENKIHVSIGSGFPCFRCSKKFTKLGYKRFLIKTPEEAFVTVLAHELRHLAQKFSSHNWHLNSEQMVLGAWSNYSSFKEERDADNWAFKKLKEYRNSEILQSKQKINK